MARMAQKGQITLPKSHSKGKRIKSKTRLSASSNPPASATVHHTLICLLPISKPQRRVGAGTEVTKCHSALRAASRRAYRDGSAKITLPLSGQMTPTGSGQQRLARPAGILEPSALPFLVSCMSKHGSQCRPRSSHSPVLSACPYTVFVSGA